MADPSVLERVLQLMDPPPAAPRTVDGYLDVLAEEELAPAKVSLAQRTMRSGFLPKIYEAAWRPLLFQLWTLRTTAAEERLLTELLAPQDGEVALDVACGPGNTTRRLRDAYAGGTVVGFDYAPGMLARATADTDDPDVAYVRGDAHDLPFADGSIDLVCCFGALYLVEDPFRVLDELLRVLAPGGRIALMTTVDRGPRVAQLATGLSERLGGLRSFAPDAFTSRLEDDGLVDVRQVVSGFSQTVAGTRPR